MSFNGSESATSETTPSIPETMDTTTTTPEPSIRNFQDSDNEGIETIQSLQERNKWSADQITRLSKQLDKQLGQLSEKDQEINGLKMDIELQGRQFQREIDQLEDQVSEKMDVLINKEESIAHLREELRRVKFSGELAQVGKTYAQGALEKLEADSEETIQTLREANQMMQDRLDAQDKQMTDYHRQEARIFELQGEIQFLDEQLVDGDIKALEKENSTTRYSFSIRASKLKTANKKLKSAIRKSARKLLCAENFIAMQNSTIERQAKEELRILICSKNYTAMQDATFEKQQKDHARELLCAKNYIAIQHRTINQQSKDEARRLRCNKNYVAK